MAIKNIRIKILDEEFVFKTDSPPEQVDKVVSFFNQCLEHVVLKNKNISRYKAAILAALNITEKYFYSLEKHTELKLQVSEKSQKILNLFDSAFAGEGHEQNHSSVPTNILQEDLPEHAQPELLRPEHVRDVHATRSDAHLRDVHATRVEAKAEQDKDTKATKANAQATNWDANLIKCNVPNA